MNDLTRYLSEHGGRTIAEWPLNEVDLMLFSQIAFSDFGAAFAQEEIARGIPFGEALLRTNECDPGGGFPFQDRDDQELRTKMAETERFRDMVLTRFSDLHDVASETQFTAMTVDACDGTRVIAFRGTDASVIGWKETCNLAVMSPVPSQVRALAYVETEARISDKPMRLCGHSKGGNCAVYAAARVTDAAREKIVSVTSYDGPGLDKKTAGSKGFLLVRDRVRVIMPRGSIVALLFDQRAEVTYVRGRMPGLLQHYIYNWRVQNGAFVRAQAPTAGGAYFARAMQGFLESLSQEDRYAFVELLYNVLAVSEAETMTGFIREWRKNVPRALKAISSITPETKAMFFRVLRRFFAELVRAMEVASEGGHDHEIPRGTL